MFVQIVRPVWPGWQPEVGGDRPAGQKHEFLQICAQMRSPGQFKREKLNLSIYLWAFSPKMRGILGRLERLKGWHAQEDPECRSGDGRCGFFDPSKGSWFSGTRAGPRLPVLRFVT
jgi:hypothetical protein